MEDKLDQQELVIGRRRRIIIFSSVVAADCAFRLLKSMQLAEKGGLCLEEIFVFPSIISLYSRHALFGGSDTTEASLYVYCSKRFRAQKGLKD